MAGLKERYNVFWVGLILGLIGPVFGFVAFYLFTSTRIPLENFIKFIRNTPSTHSSIISVSLIFNLVFFFTGSRLDMLRVSQGVIGGTLIYAPFIIYFKYVA